MKIYTKKGDSGTTQLIGGTRLPKDNIRIEAYGAVDELNAFVGMVRDNEGTQEEKEVLIRIQDRLFVMGSLLAADPDKNKMKLPELEEADITLLEERIDAMDSALPEMTNFILPGGHISVSTCHVARCVCRRAERLCITLDHEYTLNPLILKYLNRLSDYLFILARKIGQNLEVEETPWKP